MSSEMDSTGIIADNWMDPIISLISPLAQDRWGCIKEKKSVLKKENNGFLLCFPLGKALPWFKGVSLEILANGT